MQENNLTNSTGQSRNIPKLRFPQFSGEWKNERIDDYVDLISGIALKSDEISENKNGIPILRGVNITEGFIRHSQEIDRYFISHELTKYEKYFLKVNDLVIGMDGSKVGKNVALITNADQNSILIQRVARIRSNKKSNIQFIYQNIFSKKFQDYVDVVNTSSGIPHISSQQIKDFEIGFPSLTEQQKIASFLSAVDDKLQALKKKKSLLEQYKKGLMQKIFSQELRFKADDGSEFPEWEEKKLGEIGDVKMCRRIFNDETLPEGEIPFYKIGSFGKNADAFISRELYIEYRTKFSFPTKGDILISAAGTIGRLVVYNGEDAYFQDSNIVWIDNDKSIVSNEFLFYILQIVKYNTEGGTIQRLYNNILKSTKFNCPSLPEQTKIANFLSAIDDKINLVSGQVEKMEMWKKGLLQKMFV